MSLRVSYENVDDFDIDKILSIVTESNLVPKAKNRFKLLELIYTKIFNFSLEKDLILSVLDESNHKMILAPAGSGKTTTIAGAEIILQKLCRKSVLTDGLIQGGNMLYLVYNKGNVKDIKARHTELVSKVRLSGMTGIEYLNDDLNVSTLHSFCSSWILEPAYMKMCKLERNNLITDEGEELNLMFNAANTVIKSNPYGITMKEISTSNLTGLYNYKRESLLDFDDLELNDKFIDLNLPIELIEKIFNTYEITKKMKKKYDYTDQLLIFNNLISGVYDSNNEHIQILDRLNRCYEYIAADELQDFTPLMMEILVKISKKVRLTCIGDDDQSLYEFKGADCNNILKFQDRYPDSKVFLLKTNRRCPKNIVDLSKFVISSNKNRFMKDIKSVKPSGVIEYRPYSDRRGQLLSVINEIKSMSDLEKSSTCICYRNQSCSSELSNLLMESGIHFHILSGIQPFSYGLYRTMVEILRMLSSGSSKVLNLNLYKCLPITKDEVNRALQYDPIKRVFKDNNYIMHLSEIDFGNKHNNQTFSNNLNWLIYVSKNIESMKLSEYFPRLLTMVKSYYWDYLVNVTKLDTETDKSFTNSVSRYFNVEKPFPVKFIEYERDKASIEQDQRGSKGVCISTFHSLKGLEFDNVILIDLQESIFPNSAGIDSRPYPSNIKMKLKEGENRLFYVAITRPRKKLIMYYHKTDPSLFITRILGSYKPETDVLSAKSLNLEMETSNSFSKKREDLEDEFYYDQEVMTVEEHEPKEDIKTSDTSTPKNKGSNYTDMIMDTFFG